MGLQSSVLEHVRFLRSPTEVPTTQEGTVWGGLEPRSSSAAWAHLKSKANRLWEPQASADSGRTGLHPTGSHGSPDTLESKLSSYHISSAWLEY